MTHAELVRRAARWLKMTMGCHVVLVEHSAGREHPDAIGWRSGLSIAVECKISRSDFLRDRLKPSRRTVEDRPALWCYYLTPPPLVRATDLPLGWGLLHAEARQVRVVVPAPPANTNGRHWPPPVDERTPAQLRAELYRLYCEVRRYQVQGLRPQTAAAFLQARARAAADERDRDR